MARVKKGVNAHKRHKKILKLAKGFYGTKSKVFRAANPAVMRSLRSAYVGRKLKKRQYRQMWLALKSTEKCFPKWLSMMHQHSQHFAKQLRRLTNSLNRIKEYKSGRELRNEGTPA